MCITEEEYFVWLVSKLKFCKLIVTEPQAEKLLSPLIISE